MTLSMDKVRLADRAACCIAVAAILSTVGCSPISDSGPPDGRLAVFAGIPPLQYVVEQIGGAHVKVDVLMQPGQDPHTFEASPQQLAALGRAAVFFKIGMPFETVVLEKIQEGNTRLAVVDSTEGIQKRPLIETEHEPGGRQGRRTLHGDELDPHVWLSPLLLKVVAANVAQGLCRADPAHKDEYRRNATTLAARLDALHREIDEKLAPYRGRAFYVFHPGFAYFADAYGLREEAIEVGGQSPAAKEFFALVARAKGEGVKVVFVQPEFDSQIVQGAADALGGRVETINGLAKDVPVDIEDIAAKIQRAMKESDPPPRGGNKP